MVRVDTDSGIYGLGEMDELMGVNDGIAYMRASISVGAIPLTSTPSFPSCLYGSQPPGQPEAREGIMPGGIIACSSSSPTATPWGPVAWAASGVEMALCDLIGKVFKTPAYNLLGGKFRDKVRVYLDRSCPREIQNLAAWREMAAATAESGFGLMKFDIDYIASDCIPDAWNRSVPLRHINKAVERLDAVRQTVGPDVLELCVDCRIIEHITCRMRFGSRKRWRRCGCSGSKTRPPSSIPIPAPRSGPGARSRSASANHSWPSRPESSSTARPATSCIPTSSIAAACMSCGESATMPT